MTWPYENGRPLRCVACGCAPAIKVQHQRHAGPYCRAHLPVSPTVPSWRVGRCRKCPEKGARVVDPRGRVSGPWCALHRPAPQSFSAAADELLTRVVAEQLAYEMPRPRVRP